MGRPDPREPAAVRAGGARWRIDVVPAAGVLRVARAPPREGPNPDRADALLRCVVPELRRVAGLETFPNLMPTVTSLPKFPQQVRQLSQGDDLAFCLHGRLCGRAKYDRAWRQILGDTTLRGDDGVGTNLQVVGDAGLARQRDVVANLHAARDAGLRDHDAVLAKCHVMRDLHEIVD